MQYSYDYDSVMHYDKYAFSKNGKPTMVPKKNVEIGNKDGLSKTDIKEIKSAYNSGNKKNGLNLNAFFIFSFICILIANFRFF